MGDETDYDSVRLWIRPARVSGARACAGEGGFKEIRMMKLGLSAALVLSVAGLACAQDTPAPKPAPAKEAAPKKAEPTLKVGDLAPEFAVEKWVKGESITGFEKGKIYVVEFWATWCGPCIAQFPHLSEIQSHYKDKGVSVIGVNIWEDKDYNDETFTKVTEFVKSQDTRMSYNVAFDGAAKVMDTKWMQAAGRGGIPSAFVVDQAGKIAYVDHPMFMDECIEGLIAGTWDASTGAEKTKKLKDAYMEVARNASGDGKAAMEAWTKLEKTYPTFAKHQSDLKLRVLQSAGEWDKAYAMIGEKVDAAIKAKDAMSLNALAWGIVDPEAEVAKRDVALAMRAAEAAVKITEEKDGAILDTLARCYWLKGDKAKAIEVQKKAVAVSTPEFKEQLEDALKEYEKGATK